MKIEILHRSTWSTNKKRAAENITLNRSASKETIEDFSLKTTAIIYIYHSYVY